MKRIKNIILILLVVVFILSGCSSSKSQQRNYEGRTFYEIFVRAFNDSNGDGIGDLNGVTEKLDYLENLGIKGIWLMPITKSTSYHGYDTVDYYTIDEDYGTIDDLKKLINEANKRDIKVIMDLVINHTSTEHPWFIEAREDENSKYRDYYIWNNDMSKTKETSAMGTKPWTENGDKEELYYSIFWSGMPDLNMDNEDVIKEIQDIAKYYLELGIDGFRLDAAKWIFEEKERNIDFWTNFSSYVKSINKDAILVGEVWDNPYSIYEYSKSLDSFFEFSLGTSIVEKLFSNSIATIPDIYNNWESLYKEENQNFILSTFLSNHDQNRIMSQLQNEDSAKMAAAIYLTLPGTPYIYYGEELGMTGVKPDERIREPFIWSSTDLSRNTTWIDSENNISKIALDLQMDDKNSIYNLYKDIIKLRNENPSLRYGKVEGIDVGKKSILVMKRTYENEITTIIVNSSKNNETISLGRELYKVLYCSGNKKVGSKLNRDITLSPGEILIVR